MKFFPVKRFNFEKLQRMLTEQDAVILAFAFGSARSGYLMSKDSDVDIALWLSVPFTGEIRLLLLNLCRQSLDYDNIDLTILNHSTYPIRFEALSGVRLVIKDFNLYAELFSETCRYCEEDMLRQRINEACFAR